MDTNSLRMLWQVVNKLSPDSLMHMPYDELVGNLLSQLSQQQALSSQDWLDIQSYLSQKELLIRELFSD